MIGAYQNILRSIGFSILIFLIIAVTYIFLWACLPPYLISQLNNLLGLNKLAILIILLTIVTSILIFRGKLVLYGKSMLIPFVSLFFYYVLRALIAGSTNVPPIYEFIFSIIYSIILYLILTNLFNVNSNIKISRWIQNFIIISTSISAAVGIYQMLPSMGRELPELPGLFYVKNHLGTFTAVGFALVSTRFFISKQFKKFFWFIISILLLMGVIFSMSRAAWVSATIILVLLAVYFKRKHLLILPAIVLSVILIIFWERIFDVAYLGDISTGRFLLWATFVSHFLNYGNLFTGLGVGYTFQFNPKELVGFVGFQAADNPYIYVHNDFFYFLLETGIVGLFLFLLFYIFVFRDINKFLKQERNNNEEIKIVLAVKCSLIPIIIMHLTDTFLFASGLLYYLFFLLSSAYIIVDKSKIMKFEK